jgi:xanthine dehydrogenase accessory factor
MIATDQMKEIYERIQEPSTEGRRALATIIMTKGSTPRKVGAKMLVLSDGRFLGTIGGGCGEQDVFHEAVKVIEDGQPRIVDVDLTSDEAGESGDVCGGIMQVFVEVV